MAARLASRSSGGEHANRSTAAVLPSCEPAAAALRNAGAKRKLLASNVDSLAPACPAVAPAGGLAACAAAASCCNHFSASWSSAPWTDGSAAGPSHAWLLPTPSASRLSLRQPAAASTTGSSRMRCSHTRLNCTMQGVASTRTCNERVPTGRGCNKGSPARASATAISHSSAGATSWSRAVGNSWRRAFMRRIIRRRFSRTQRSSSATVRRNWRTARGSTCNTRRMPSSPSTTTGT
mmetsp:Transcript_17109/g.47102  ORF Transcript_17109/g.47102 Transcript_17109/m.47102 type:complete len:236 (+) Transcript_17109:395-1102(+)